MDNNSIYDELAKINELRNFLEVKAPDKVIEKAFLHDLQGKSIDCDEVYTQPDGKLITKDGIEVEFVPFILHSRKRLAENENDFQEIFDVWFDKKRLNPQKQQDIIICAKFLISEVTRLQQQHEQGTNRDSVDLTLISLSNEFISFLESKQTKRESTAQHQKGFDLGLSDKQLEKLYNELKEHRFIDIKTNSKHFINAFNGKDLEEGFKPLEWIDYTMGAIFISYFFRDKKNIWIRTKHILEKASYRQLLSQSKNNGTFDRVAQIVKEIESTIKLLTDIDSK